MKKLELFSVCITKDNAQVFPSLYDSLCENELKLTDNVKCDVAKHLSGSVKILFNQKPLPDFWIGLRSEYPALANHTIRTLMPFATTYLCESGFSALMKTKYRHRLCVENDLRLRLYPIHPNIAE